MILQELVVPLLANIDEFIKNLSKAQTESTKTTQQIADKFNSVGKSLQKSGAMMSLALTTPITAFGVKAVNAASDLNETTSKIQVVFGNMADEVLKFGDNAAQALGMSKNEALSAAGTYGNLFVSMGMTTEKSADMSTGLVTLAGDLASFNNMDSSEVLEKLRSGLTGETEPLKTLGVNLNQASIEAKAMSMGLWDGEGAISASAKAQATYALILDQTKTAQGDFARTSDGLANSTRIAKAEFENMSAQLGQAVLPLVTDLIKNLIPLIQGFNNLDPATKNTILIFAGVVASIGPVIGFIGTLSSAVGTLIGLFGAGGGLAGVGTFLSATVFPAVGAAIAAVGWPVLALIAAVGGLIFIWSKFGKDATNTVYMICKIIEVEFGRVGAWLSTTFTKIWDDIGKAISNVLGWISDLGKGLSNIPLVSWLVPGSPPPLALAIDDLGTSMKKVTANVLPEFSTQLNMSGYVMPPASRNMKSYDNSNLIPYLRDIANKETDSLQIAKIFRDMQVREIG